MELDRKKKKKKCGGGSYERPLHKPTQENSLREKPRDGSGPQSIASRSPLRNIMSKAISLPSLKNKKPNIQKPFKNSFYTIKLQFISLKFRAILILSM